MHPILINLGPVPIHTYGFLIAMGFLSAVFLMRRLAVRERMDPERILDMAFWTLIVGFIGARALFILTRLDYFLSDPVSIFKVWEGGLVFFGGPLAVTPFLYWYTRKFKMPVYRTMDICAPALVIAHAFGRLGCLAAGCCYGKPTGSTWGVKLYSDLVEDHLKGVPLHPTQLYEAGSLLVLFFGLLWVFKRRHFDGQVALTYLMTYPIIRSVIEIFRGDTIRGFVIDGVLSTSQFISILVFGTAVTLLTLRLRRSEAVSR